jgi:predicted CoA-binding protein
MIFSKFTPINVRKRHMPTQIMQKIMKTTQTIAVVGLSSRPTRAGYYVPAYLQKQGYRIIPVNPHVTEALGEKAYARLSDIPEPVDLVLIFQRSDNVPPFVDEAIQIGAKSIWLQVGIAHQEAAAKAQAAGLDVVQNACLMVEHRAWDGL